MKWIEMETLEYGQMFSRPAVVFGSVQFTELNVGKVNRVIRLGLSDGEKIRLGLTAGIRPEGELCAPFSAPFAAFDFNRVQSADVMLEGMKKLREQFPGLRLTLPPEIYDDNGMIQKALCASLSAGAKVEWCDWNYHLNLKSAQDYFDSLNRIHRKKLRMASSSPYILHNTDSEPERAYAVIRRNRSHKGYPLRMSLEDVIRTTGGKSPVIDADFFVLTNGSEDAAAAIVYRNVAPDVAQVIYWGDSPDTDCPHAVNLLALLLQTHYFNSGFRVLDIGPSSECGVPSIGLCEFKERIGCLTSPKFTLRF